jgi:hypothetical protein
MKPFELLLMTNMAQIHPIVRFERNSLAILTDLWIAKSDLRDRCRQQVLNGWLVPCRRRHKNVRHVLWRARGTMLQGPSLTTRKAWT